MICSRNIILIAWVSHHKADQGEPDERGGAREALSILRRPAASYKPGEGSLDDPSSGDDEALGMIGAS